MTFRARIAPAIAALVFVASSPAVGQGTSSPWVARAQAWEQELTRDEAKLRLRHNLEKLETLWAQAASRASEAEKAQAAEGRVRAAALLARWSGRADDRARAEALRAELGSGASASRPAPAPAPEAARASSVPTLRFDRASVEVEQARTLVVLPGLGAEGPKLVRQELLGRGSERPRVYFDLRPLVAAPSALAEHPLEGGGVRRLRIGQLDEQTVRFVFDLTPGAELAKVRLETAPRLAFVVEREPRPIEPPPEVAAEPPAGAPEGEATAQTEREAILQQKAALERLLEEIVQTHAPSPSPPEPEPEPAALEAEPATPAPAPKLARSTREAVAPRVASPPRIRRVVVDAGHGGKDVGAVGRRGTREKDVNLSLALALGRRLEKELGVEVIYTRTKDTFVSLQRRTQIANAADADLFISVHSNANRNRKIRGLETYYLNTTSSRYANRLAQRENRDMHDPELIGDDSPEDLEAEDGEAPLPGGAVGHHMKLLLADLAMRSAAEASRRLAGYIQHTAVTRLQRPEHRVQDLGVKKALFFVLLGVRMPSVLVESGFLSHEEEEKQLADPRYRERLAAAIAEGVRRYVEERHELAARF